MTYQYADKKTPWTLSPETLDWHLERGWYRMGANIFTTHFLFFKDRPYSAIWLRVDLQDFKFSKRQRKLLRRNAKLFETTTAPRTNDPEREELYTRFAADFQGQLSPTVADSLEDYGEQTCFNTWETTVRERVSNRLVAYSYFDLGAVSAASIIGVYDPKLSTFSLGYYTMLLEVQYCLEQGLRYYYPGYLVPGNDRFDYKLRLGSIEYYELQTDGWQPYTDEIRERGPVERQLRYLTDVSTRLRVGHGLTAAPPPLIYPLFEAGLYDIWTDDYLPLPYVLPLGQAEGFYLLLVFDPRSNQFQLLQCQHMRQTQLLFQAGFLAAFGEGYFTELVAVRRVVAEFGTVARAVEAGARVLGSRR